MIDAGGARCYDGERFRLGAVPGTTQMGNPGLMNMVMIQVHPAKKHVSGKNRVVNGNTSISTAQSFKQLA